MEGQEGGEGQRKILTGANDGAAVPWYGVATISRLLEIIGLFCKRAL